MIPTSSDRTREAATSDKVQLVQAAAKLVGIALDQQTINLVGHYLTFRILPSALLAHKHRDSRLHTHTQTHTHTHTHTLTLTHTHTRTHTLTGIR